METQREFFHNNQDENRPNINFNNNNGYVLNGSIQNYDEPIDLTFDKRPGDDDDDAEDGMKPIPAKLTETSQNPEHFVKKRRKRKFAYTPEGKLYVLPYESVPVLFSGPAEPHVESKQVDVLKAAKSLFSKRTRTLYHWMYPNAHKQQIKSAVSNSWDSLGAQEKEFYISQVLGRFGFPQSSLMVNPQLGSIKELPSLPEVQNFNTKAHELQSAISSIMQENCNGARSSGTSFEEYEGASMGLSKAKRRRGRPSGSKNTKRLSKQELIKTSIVNDFQDDPELSNELEKFALSMFKTKIK